MENDIESTKYEAGGAGNCAPGGAGSGYIPLPRYPDCQLLVLNGAFLQATCDSAGNAAGSGGAGSNGILYEIREELKECL